MDVRFCWRYKGVLSPLKDGPVCYRQPGLPPFCCLAVINSPSAPARTPLSATQFEYTLKSFSDTTLLMQKWVEDQFARFAFDMQNYVDTILASEADVMKV